jgi:cytochrome b561
MCACSGAQRRSLLQLRLCVALVLAEINSQPPWSMIPAKLMHCMLNRLTGWIEVTVHAETPLILFFNVPVPVPVLCCVLNPHLSLTVPVLCCAALLAGH